MECIEQCNGVGECVGLAHIGQQCSICRIDSDTESHDSVPDELRKRYLLDFDYLPTMSGLLGRGRYFLLYKHPSTFIVFSLFVIF